MQILFSEISKTFVVCSNDKLLVLQILSPLNPLPYCCQSKPTSEQRRATRRTGRLLGRWQALLPRRRPAILSRARRMCESRACHLTYTRSEGCRRAPNSFLHTKTRVNISPSRGRLPGTTLALALKSRSSPGVRSDLHIWMLIDKANNCKNCFN